MLKNILTYSLATLLVAGAIGSCSKEAAEPIVAPVAQEEASGFGLSFQATALSPIEDQLRLASYDLVGDSKRMEINFLHIKNATPEQMQGAQVKKAENYNKVPVHLFFINTKLNKRFYYLKYMNVVDKKTLNIPFQNYPAIEKVFTQESEDFWYAKAFIGGMANETFTSKTNKEGNGNINKIQFSMDNLYSCDPSETSYITHTIDDTFDGNRTGLQWQQPLPFPMETPWHKIRFYFKGTSTAGSLTTGEDPLYPNTRQTLQFKPLGSLIRIQLDNESASDYPAVQFDFSPKPLVGSRRVRESAKNYDQIRDQIYGNNISRVISVDAVPKDASGYVTDEAQTNTWVGATTEWETDGNVHYHAKDYAAPASTGGSDDKLKAQHKAAIVKAGSSRTFYFWVVEYKHSKAQGKDRVFIQPYFHNTINNAANTLNNDRSATSKYRSSYVKPTGEISKSNADFNPIVLSNSNENGIWVDRRTFKDGHSYFIKKRLVNRQS